MSVKLSISIVAYHNYSDIEEAIATLEAYTPTTLTKKIYIIDNGTQKGNNIEFVSFLE